MGVKASYEKTVREFSRRVVKKLGDRLDSVIVYGSVATGRATKDSDIDVLIIAEEGDKDAVEREAVDISYDIDYENSFETFIVPVFMTPREIGREIKSGSFFIKDILAEGVVLYDNGTFGRIRKESS